MLISRSKFFSTEPFYITENLQFSAQEVINKLSPFLTEDRLNKIQKVANSRIWDIEPVLENIYDRGNISAVMRSAEAFGFINFNVISPGEKFKNSKRVTQGAEKWLNVREFKSTKDCVRDLKQRGVKIFATDLNSDIDLEDADFSGPSALVLGNEKEGISAEMAELADHRICIPMNGFIQSFNISVAAALSFYHIYNFRLKCVQKNVITSEQIDLIKANYIFNSVQRPIQILKSGL
ncbi:MAG: RNA methyltransferase [Bdellovibrionales bacterium]|nr:RNA methyltransferase [Bdellovibrionales bacterium]